MATARTKDPSVVFFISNVACAGEIFMAGTTDIFNLHVLVGHKARSALSDPKMVSARPVPEIESRHARVGGSATFPLVYGQVTFIGEWRHDDDREHPACPHRT